MQQTIIMTILQCHNYDQLADLFVRMVTVGHSVNCYVYIQKVLNDSSGVKHTVATWPHACFSSLKRI